MKNLKEVKQALKNNCFNVYLPSDNNNIRIRTAKTVKGVLMVQDNRGKWHSTEYNKLIQA